MTHISLEAVSAGYGDVEILHALSIDAPSGQTTCLIGANGAGKSTALKVMFGILPVRSGRVLLGGRDVTSLNARQRLEAGMTYVAQGRCNFARMTVRENLEMGGYALPERQTRVAVGRVLENFPLLAEREKTLAGQLSGGQQQILEMAMALVPSPAVLLIDEPSLGLAPNMIDFVFQEIKRVNAGGVTVIMVEQNARRALQISDHAVALEQGRVVRIGTGMELFGDPEIRVLYLGGASRRPGETAGGY